LIDEGHVARRVHLAVVRGDDHGGAILFGERDVLIEVVLIDASREQLDGVRIDGDDRLVVLRG
jgi:hypothetical protein